MSSARDEREGRWRRWGRAVLWPGLMVMSLLVFGGGPLVRFGDQEILWSQMLRSDERALTWCSAWVASSDPAKAQLGVMTRQAEVTGVFWRLRFTQMKDAGSEPMLLHETVVYHMTTWGVVLEVVWWVSIPVLLVSLWVLGGRAWAQVRVATDNRRGFEVGPARKSGE